MKLYSLKCEDSENIFIITIEATNINEAIELAKDYVNKHNLQPIGIWEV